MRDGDYKSPEAHNSFIDVMVIDSMLRVTRDDKVMVLSMRSIAVAVDFLPPGASHFSLRLKPPS